MNGVFSKGGFRWRFWSERIIWFLQHEREHERHGPRIDGVFGAVGLERVVGAVARAGGSRRPNDVTKSPA